MSNYFKEDFYTTVTVDTFLVITKLMPEIVETFMSDHFLKLIRHGRSDIIIELLKNGTITIDKNCPDENRLHLCDDLADEFMKILIYLKDTDYRFSCTDVFTLNILKTSLFNGQIQLLDFFISNTDFSQNIDGPIDPGSVNCHFTNIDTLKLLESCEFCRKLFIEVFKTDIHEYSNEEIEEIVSLMTIDETEDFVAALLGGGYTQDTNSLLHLNALGKLDRDSQQEFVLNFIDRIEESELIRNFTYRELNGLVIKDTHLSDILKKKPTYDFETVEKALGIRFDWDSLTSKDIMYVLRYMYSELGEIIDALLRNRVDVAELLRSCLVNDISKYRGRIESLQRAGFNEEEACLLVQKIEYHMR